MDIPSLFRPDLFSFKKASRLDDFSFAPFLVAGPIRELLRSWFAFDVDFRSPFLVLETKSRVLLIGFGVIPPFWCQRPICEVSLELDRCPPSLVWQPCAQHVMLSASATAAWDLLGVGSSSSVTLSVAVDHFDQNLDFVRIVIVRSLLVALGPINEVI